MTISDGKPHIHHHIHVSDEGARDAPALLLIHGFAASARSWDSLVPLLTQSHRVIRIDLLGHGQSAKPDCGGYAIPDHARRAGAALDRLGVRRAIVVGHSTVGAVATALAEQRPELVSALVLINTGPSMGAYIAPRFAVGPEQWPELTDGQIRQTMSSAFGRPDYPAPQQLVDDVRGMTYHAFTATMLASHEYLAQQSLPDRLAAIGAALLVLFGEDDRRWRSSPAAEYHAVPGAKVELLPGVGHSPILEDPPRTAAPLRAFAAARST